MKSDFVSNVSHDIRNPLAIIETHARALARPNVSEERRIAYARTIAEAAGRLDALVSNTLKLTKLESQGIVPEARDYDLSRQLTDAALALIDMFEAKGVTLDVDVADHAIVHADPGILDIAWSNILGNALKYTEPGGHVTLHQWTKVGADGPLLAVEVMDDGCGMGETEVAHVFDKFYQGDTPHAGEGNGLGMAMVKRAVELSHGRVTVTSVKRAGTVVAVTLPAVS
nr:HAMP domain-containing sensor histidine kinase [Bifidobacterium sp. DSM 109958]